MEPALLHLLFSGGVGLVRVRDRTCRATRRVLAQRHRLVRGGRAAERVGAAAGYAWTPDGAARRDLPSAFRSVLAHPPRVSRVAGRMTTSDKPSLLLRAFFLVALIFTTIGVLECAFILVDVAT